jgi:hypothetical protein
MSDFQFYPVMFATKLWAANIVRRYSEQSSARRPFVFHYTTGEGLKGIIQNRCLWATGAYYLNDTSEIESGCSLAANVVQQCVASAHSSFSRAVLQQARALLSDPAKKQIRIIALYVSCFCESDNLLSQWRAYGRSGGFALGFRADELRGLQAENTTVSLDKVLYSGNDQTERVRRIIGSALEILRDQEVVRGSDDDAPIDDILAAASEIAKVLLSAITSFKSPDFAEEQEWRLICQPYHADDKEKVEAIHKIIRFRSSSRGLIPYLELKAPNPTENLPIDSVRFGPTQNPELVHSATRMLLDANGLQSVKIEGSKISVVLEH